LSSIHPIHENKINPKISTTEILRKRNAVGTQEEKSESNKNIQKITISKLDYKGQTKIRVHHPFLPGQMEKLRTIAGYTWTQTYRCWYLPYNKESFAKLKVLFPCIINLEKKIDSPQQNTIIPEVIQKNETPIIEVIEQEYKTPVKDSGSKPAPESENKQNQGKIRIKINALKTRIKLSHGYQPDIFKTIRQIEKAFWVKESKSWVLPYSEKLLDELKLLADQFGLSCEIAEEKDERAEDKHPEVKRFLDYLYIKRYSQNTVEAYFDYFRNFAYSFEGKDLETLGFKQLLEYVQQNVKEKQLSEAQTRHLVCSIKLYYEKLLNRPKMVFHLQPIQVVEPTPTLLDFDNILKVIEQISSVHDRLLFFMCYYLGLTAKQVSEITLEQTNLIPQNLLLVNHFPARKLYNRLVSDHLKALAPMPLKFLFEQDGNPYSTESVREKVLRMVSRYKLIDVYRIQYQNAIDQTDFTYNTKKTYISSFLSFLKWFDYKHPALITWKEISAFLVNQKKISIYYQNHYISCLKFYYEHINKKKVPPGVLERPRSSEKLPDVLSAEEIFSLIQHIENPKHRCIVALTYSTGMRISEVLSMKISDIDFERNMIHIRQGKGRKDRNVPLDEFTKSIIEQYFAHSNPSMYMFEGSTGEKYSATSFRKILKLAAQKAGVKRRVYPHLLRHSIATHLLEQGQDLRTIQEFLGHANIDTTTRYTHIANNIIKKIENPMMALWQGAKQKPNSHAPP